MRWHLHRWGKYVTGVTGRVQFRYCKVCNKCKIRYL